MIILLQNCSFSVPALSYVVQHFTADAHFMLFSCTWQCTCICFTIMLLLPLVVHMRLSDHYCFQDLLWMMNKFQKSWRVGVVQLGVLSKLSSSFAPSVVQSYFYAAWIHQKELKTLTHCIYFLTLIDQLIWMWFLQWNQFCFNQAPFKILCTSFMIQTHDVHLMTMTSWGSCS